MNFQFGTADRILFGPGTAKEVPEQTAAMGKRALVVTGKSGRHADWLIDALTEHSVTAETFAIPSEPTVWMVQAGADKARELGCDVVIGIGGGSVVDGGKAIAALVNNRGDLFDYLEVIGKGKPLTEAPVPCIAVPTTAGTGAEVARNAVIASPEHRRKVSLRHPLMLPKLAVVDPELTYSMPRSVTASTGLDALTQVMEPYVSHLANPLTDGICREGMARAARSLRRAYENGNDIDARQDMALASLFGGLALTNAKLGAVHGFAGPLGGLLGAPHGTICAALLPHVMAINVRALRQRDRENPALPRYDEIARIFTGAGDATADEGVAWVRDLCAALAVPPLSQLGLRAPRIPKVVEMSKQSSSMKGNPLPLTDAELVEILQRAM